LIDRHLRQPTSCIETIEQGKKKKKLNFNFVLALSVRVLIGRSGLVGQLLIANLDTALVPR
jgi:hypothetical protein